MVDKDGPRYGFDIRSAVELKTYQTRPNESQLPFDHDEARLLEPFDSGVYFAESQRDFPRATTKVPAFFSNLHRDILRPSRGRYTPFGSSDGLLPEQPNRFHGWRNSVIAAACVTGFVFLVNTSFAIYASRFAQSDGVGTIYTGDCNLVKRWDTALHLLINLLGTALLGASSFTMQCLTSPTRSEADQAHSKKMSLDIGVSSFKNLFYVHWTKAVLWWMLALSTIPLHLLWNSTIFSTLGANEFSYFIVDESFLEGSAYKTPYDNCDATPGPSFDTIYQSYKAGNFSNRVEVSDCISSYASSFVTGKRHLLAVTKPYQGMRMSPGCAFAAEESSSVGASGFLEPLWNGSSMIAFENELTNQDLSWLCLGYNFTDDQNNSCDRSMALSALNQYGGWYLRPQDWAYIFSQDTQAYLIEYCLIEDKVPDKCTLQFVSYILYAVIGCNAVKVICMVAAAMKVWDLDEPILATVGDAVASYIDKPDPTTQGWCLLRRQDLSKWRGTNNGTKKPDVYNVRKTVRLFSATSKTKWTLTMSLCLLYLATGIALYFASLPQLNQYSISQLFKLGFGAINSSAVFGDERYSSHAIMVDILIANSFQIALSTTYFLYNSLYTAQCAATEWASYASFKHSLRVSYPRGLQKSTFYLHLPYRFMIPLNGMLMLVHFLISQSIFLARVQWYDEDGSIDVGNYISSVGYSPIAIFVTCCVGGVLILLQILNSLRSLNATIPIHGNSSVIISAACHPKTQRNGNHEGSFQHAGNDISLGEVMWGVTVPAGPDLARDDNIGHCTFTSEQLNAPEPGRRYQ